MPFPLLRSETVKKGTIVTSTEAAYRTVAALGQTGKLHLEDENSETMIRPYNSTLQRLDQIDQKIRYVCEQLEGELKVEMCVDNVDNFLENAQESYKIDEIEKSISYHYERMKIFSTNNAYFISNKYALLEELGLLSLPSSFFHTQPTRDINNNMITHNEQNFSVICGTIPMNISQRFMRAITMLAHANVLVLGEQILDTYKEYDRDYIDTHLSNSKKNKYKQTKTTTTTTTTTTKGTHKIFDFAFFIYFHGTNHGYLYQSLMRLIHAFEAHIYTYISDVQQRVDKQNELISAIHENNKATDAYHQFIVNEMFELTAIVRTHGNSLIEEWRLYVEREKLIYTTLNKFQGSDATLRINCWLLEKDEEMIRYTLASINQDTHSDAFLIVDQYFPEKSHPPTYLRSNDFVAPFQFTVDTYGVPRYKEVNPGLFTIVPFPFLFAVMFGDVGHGLVLFIAALLIFISGEKGVLSSVYTFRFFVLLCGMFAIFTGSLYNEFFGIGVNLFGGRYSIDTELSTHHETYYTPNIGPSFPYPWGLDPLWRAANNELTFLNSFKMKFSIIAGCVQMIFGILLRGVNCIYFNQKIDFILVFIPQLIFFLGFVGYLVFLIAFKWLTSPTLYNKPSLINTFIGVFLMTPISDNDILYTQQGLVQNIIVYCILICVPILILGKPIVETIYNKMQHNKQNHTKHNNNNNHQIQSNLSTHISVNNHHHDNPIHNSSPPSTNTSSPTSTPPMSSSNTFEIIVDESTHIHNNTITPTTHTTTTRPTTTVEQQQNNEQINTHTHDIQKTTTHSTDEDEDHSFTGLLTHQFMESTEFLLGALSNTASYLRLWALSLAHAELSKIILDQLFMMFLTMSDDLPIKCVFLFFGTIVFVWCTTIVIMQMDLIEAILHGVRLQWVEFQNKFYAADGTPFIGFSFKTGLLPSASI